MRRSREIKIFALALALTIAIVATVMILGIQIGFNHQQKDIQITLPIITAGFVVALFVYKVAKKEYKSSLLLKHAEMKGKRFNEYVIIFFSYFDYMLAFAILSGACGIVSGVLSSVYNTIRIDAITNWAYGLGRMAIVFAVYVLCVLIYTVGAMIAHSKQPRLEKKEQKDERD